jgi:hypothetical protein
MSFRVRKQSREVHMRVRVMGVLGDYTHLGFNGTGSGSAPALVRDLTCTLAKRYQLIRGQALVNFMQTGRPEYFNINRGDRSQAEM